MNSKGNTILITGGGSGIGQGLAERFHALGNQVIICGRNKKTLDQTTAANPGMQSLTLDIENVDEIRSFAARITKDFPTLNVVVHNAGIMRVENLKDQTQDVSDSEAMIATNLLGPIRLNAALLPLLRSQAKSTIMMVSSGLAFVPLAITPTYCATKAAIHSYTQSLRLQLAGTTTEVMELIPPYVQTQLMGKHQEEDPHAMPLKEFLDEVMHIVTDQPSAMEICVERVKPLRYASEGGNFENVFKGLNQAFAG